MSAQDRPVGCTCEGGPECNDSRCSYGMHWQVPDHRWLHHDPACPLAKEAEGRFLWRHIDEED